MPVQQEATILVPSEDPKKKKPEEKAPDVAADNSKAKGEGEDEELVGLTVVFEIVLRC